MGIAYDTMLDLTWREYDYYLRGYFRKIERGWDYTRNVIASLYNASGLRKTALKVDAVMKLPLLDSVVKRSLVKKVPQRKLETMLNILNDVSNI